MSITWKSVYETQIKKVDEQHRMLIDMINILEDAKGRVYEPQLLRDLFFKLVDYTKFHFAEEETLMKNSKYPKLGEHSGQHKEFVHKIVEMLGAVKEGDPGISDKLLKFLMSWLIDHILGYDKEFANYYKVVYRNIEI
jgi:hemerythrin-like metal-binding protein